MTRNYSIRWLLFVTTAVALGLALFLRLSHPPRIALSMAAVVASIPSGVDRRTVHRTIGERFKTESLKFDFQVSHSDTPLVSDRIDLPRYYAAVFFYGESGELPDDYILLSAMVVGPDGQPVDKDKKVFSLHALMPRQNE